MTTRRKQFNALVRSDLKYLVHRVFVELRPATPGVEQRHHEPDCGMDRAPNHRGIPLGSGSPLSRRVKKLKWPRSKGRHSGAEGGSVEFLG
jgi:hypothetical protein